MIYVLSANFTQKLRTPTHAVYVKAWQQWVSATATRANTSYV